MAFICKQVSLTTSAQSLTTLGFEAQHFYTVQAIIGTGSAAVGYGGDSSSLTNVPANAGFTFTASLPYNSPALPFQAGYTSNVFLTASATAQAYVTIWV